MSDQPLSHIPGLNTLKIYQNVTTGLWYPDCSADSTKWGDKYSTTIPPRAVYVQLSSVWASDLSFLCKLWEAVQRKPETGRWGKFCLSSPLSFPFLLCCCCWSGGKANAGLCRWAGSFKPAFHPTPRPIPYAHAFLFFCSWDRISASCLSRPWTWDTPASASKLPGSTGLYHQYQLKLNLNRIFCDLYIQTRCMVSPLSFCHKHTKSYKSLKSSSRAAASHQYPQFPFLLTL